MIREACTGARWSARGDVPRPPRSALVRGAPLLRDVSIRMSYSVTDEVVLILGRLPLLTNLDFVDCRDVYESDLEAMDKSRKDAGLPKVSWYHDPAYEET